MMVYNELVIHIKINRAHIVKIKSPRDNVCVMRILTVTKEKVYTLSWGMNEINLSLSKRSLYPCLSGENVIHV